MSSLKRGQVQPLVRGGEDRQNLVSREHSGAGSGRERKMSAEREKKELGASGGSFWRKKVDKDRTSAE